MMKFDPYINVDPGTMSPFQHGEVFVTEDSWVVNKEIKDLIKEFKFIPNKNLSAIATNYSKMDQ